jgi:four helix bundle protein
MNHVSIALGSHGEVFTCVEAARRLEFVTAEQCHAIHARIELVGKLLYGLYRSLESRSKDERA